MRRLSYAIILIPLFLSACAIQFQTSSGNGASKADGGIFTSLDYGDTWTQKVFVRQEVKSTVTIGNMDIGSITFDPTDSTTAYASTFANGIWKTVDTASTWTQTALKTGYVQGFDIDAHETKTLFAGVGNTVQMSTDGGTTWTTVYTNQPGNTITQVRISPADGKLIYATTNGNVLLKSTDQGTTWKILYQFQDDYVKRLTLLRSDPKIMYAVTTRSLFRSTDGGVTWNDSMGQGLAAVNGLPVNDFTYTDQKPTVMFVASNAGLFRSLDAGSTWRLVPTVIPTSTVPILAVAINPFNDKEIYFTAGATFYKSIDNGVTWQTLKTVASTRDYRILLAHPRRPGLFYLGTVYVKRK